MGLMHVDFFSEVLGMCTQIDVILPDMAKSSIGVGNSSQESGWKVLYLLHGLSDDHTIWQRRTSIERYVSDKPLAVIMPTTQRGWYTDMEYGFKWFTFMTEELPSVCKRLFPGISTKREDTFVAGLSMGGYGALKLALSCPEKYSYAASLSGALDVEELATQSGIITDPLYWSDIFGPSNQIKGSKHDLYALAEKVVAENRPLPEIYLWCGKQDGLYPHSVRMNKLLNRLNYSVMYEESDGVHAWEYWDAKIQTVLSWLPLGKEKK